jgi:catechol 2,3-dioxygenase-like lactoylglutathione lyase family enzyme
MNMKQNISFVTFAVDDFAKELTFYSDTLGWKPFNLIENTIAFFNTGSFVFSICSYNELSEDTGFALTTKPYLGVTLAQNVPNEQAVDEVFAHIRATGGTITKEPVRTSWGGYSGYFADPEGHLWEVAHNPQFEYGDDGIMIIPKV